MCAVLCVCVQSCVKWKLSTPCCRQHQPSKRVAAVRSPSPIACRKQRRRRNHNRPSNAWITLCGGWRLLAECTGWCEWCVRVAMIAVCWHDVVLLAFRLQQSNCSERTKGRVADARRKSHFVDFATHHLLHGGTRERTDEQEKNTNRPSEIWTSSGKHIGSKSSLIRCFNVFEHNPRAYERMRFYARICTSHSSHLTFTCDLIVRWSDVAS